MLAIASTISRKMMPCVDVEYDPRSRSRHCRVFEKRSHWGRHQVFEHKGVR